MHIEWEGFSATLQRKRIKNINLRIHRSGDIRVSAPLTMPLQLIHNFLNKQQAWISRQQRRLQTLQEPVPNEYETGNRIYFLGQPYTIRMQQDSDNPRVEMNEEELIIFIKYQQKEAHSLLSNWYRQQMLHYVPDLLQKWEAIIGVTARGLLIKTMKSRWGSCHLLKQQITLNLRLIEKPLICLEYVLVHELVHLLEPSHNKRFYALMTKYLPEWKSIKQLCR